MKISRVFILALCCFIFSMSVLFKIIWHGWRRIRHEGCWFRSDSRYIFFKHGPRKRSDFHLVILIVFIRPGLWRFLIFFECHATDKHADFLPFSLYTREMIGFSAGVSGFFAGLHEYSGIFGNLVAYCVRSPAWKTEYKHFNNPGIMGQTTR